MNKEQATAIVETLNDQGFLALDDDLTVDEMVELVLKISSYQFTTEEIILSLHEFGHLCIDDDQIKEVINLAESL